MATTESRSVLYRYRFALAAGVAQVLLAAWPVPEVVLQRRWMPIQQLYRTLRPVTAEDFWTMVASACTIGLLVMAKRGLNSVRLAKADIRLRSEREAKHCAITRCEEMAASLITQNSQIRKRLAEAKLALFARSPADVDFKSPNPELIVKAKEWIAGGPPDLHSEAIRFLNRLEAWSMYFVTGVADHEVAFAPCGLVFCAAVVTNLPYLLNARSNNTHGSGGFPNIVALFTDWTHRMEQEKNNAQISELIAKARGLQEKDIEKVRHLPSHPLGMGEVD